MAVLTLCAIKKNTSLIITVICTVLALAILLVAAASVAIVAFVGWVWIGMRFSPEAAIECVGLGASELPYFDADGWRFYYETDYDDSDWICEVRPVEKQGIFWYAVTRPRMSEVSVADSGAYAGGIYMQECGDEIHVFYIPPISGYPEGYAPDFIADGYDSITVNGEEIEVFKHSYFVVDEPFDSFVINGNLLIVN